MSKWNSIQFEKLYLVPSKNGTYKPKEFHGRGSKMINMGEIFGCEFIGSQEMQRVDLSLSEIESFGVMDGDLLFGRRSLVESGAGKCSLVTNISEPTAFESSIIRVRLNQSKAFPMFYYYWLKSHHGRAKIKSLVTGTNVKGIRSSELKNILVPHLSLVEQQRIAGVLYLYDQLIENNKRQISLLEESARLIYKEWFVHLRFPGYEKIKIINGVPDGWEKSELNTFADVKSGFAFKSEDYSTQEGTPIVRTRDFSSSIFIEIGEDIRIPSNIAYKYDAYKLKYLDFLLIMVGASIGSFGIVLSSEVGYLQNQNMWSIYTTKEDVPQVFIVETMKFMIRKVLGHKVGAARDFFRKDSVRNLSIVIPSRPILNKFSNVVLPLYEQIDLLRKINKQLVASKELLMPRLMNGEVEL